MSESDDVQGLVKRLRCYHGGEAPYEAADTIERLLADFAQAEASRQANAALYERALADRDAQVREAEERAFNAAWTARAKLDQWPLPDWPTRRAEAFAAYQTRQPAAGARTEEQKP